FITDNKARLFTQVGTPKHLFAKRREKIIVIGSYHLNGERGTGDGNGCMFPTAEAVPVNGDQEAVAAAAHIQMYGLVGRQDKRTHGQTVRSYRRKADHIGAGSDYRTAYTQGIGCRTGRGGYNK